MQSDKLLSTYTDTQSLGLHFMYLKHMHVKCGRYGWMYTHPHTLIKTPLLTQRTWYIGDKLFKRLHEYFTWIVQDSQVKSPHTCCEATKKISWSGDETEKPAGCFGNKLIWVVQYKYCCKRNILLSHRHSEIFHSRETMRLFEEQTKPPSQHKLK